MSAENEPRFKNAFELLLLIGQDKELTHSEMILIAKNKDYMKMLKRLTKKRKNSGIF